MNYYYYYDLPTRVGKLQFVTQYCNLKCSIFRITLLVLIIIIERHCFAVNFFKLETEPKCSMFLIMKKPFFKSIKRTIIIIGCIARCTIIHLDRFSNTNGIVDFSSRDFRGVKKRAFDVEINEIIFGNCSLTGQVQTKKVSILQYKGYRVSSRSYFANRPLLESKTFQSPRNFKTYRHVMYVPSRSPLF